MYIQKIIYTIIKMQILNKTNLEKIYFWYETENKKIKLDIKPDWEIWTRVTVHYDQNHQIYVRYMFRLTIVKIIKI